MKKMSNNFLILTIIYFAWLNPLSAQSQIIYGVSVSGGNTVTTKSRILRASVGQPLIGETYNSSEAAAIGFWYQSLDLITGVEEDESGKIPAEFKLFQNYPNPFNPVTIIKFNIPEITEVNLSVFNILGQEVAELLNKEMDSGHYEIEFNGSNFASGVYIYRIKAGNFINLKKMILVK